ncbi:HlyD family secretion protein [Legionella clemsonensis]|uniref:Colicin V secretion protein CvaA n=1 Tax=Legionella clemsonensis TaxID=1867846 RepID=A0A222NYG1_9GAMM|nr:HlyD family efflux transporter periplasmic adaptor subunit [Legionella clemsonensis]ASQ44611.1 Colicin V secretion protein CvaA [Legionella clemsonensis]
MKEEVFFRPEVLQHKKEKIYGSIYINTPPGYTFLTIGFSLFIFLIILFLIFAEFSEKFIVSGYVNSTKAFVRVYPKMNGIIAESYIHQGERIAKNSNLFLIDTSFKSNEQNMAAQLEKRRKLIEKEIAQKSKNLAAMRQLLQKNYLSQAEYNQKQEELYELKNKESLLEMDRINYQQSRSFIIHAPIEGIISSVLYKEGQYITSSKLLLTIIPTDAELIAELFIPARKAGFLDTNSKVLIRYDAYPYQRFGTYSATIKEISQNIMTDEEEEKPIRIGEPYYKVIASLERQHVMVYGKEKKIQHGMTISAVVVGSKRKLWQWILDPLYSYYGKLFT